jgi:hypothetical protein
MYALYKNNINIIMRSISFYVFVIGILFLCLFVGQKWKNIMYTDNSKDEYAMIKDYLLNDSPLYGYNRPKIWIHSTYDINARKWKNFQSRNSTDLNQPYLYLTVQSIIRHCGNDFHVCLIDDESFLKLIPNWDIDLVSVAEPMRSQFRDIAMLQLLYNYGGFVVPNSFLCTKNLIDIYTENIGSSSGEWFVVESRTNTKDNNPFLPDITFTGSNKNNETILSFITVLKSKWNGHFSQEMEFQGFKNHWLINQLQQHPTNIKLVNGEYFGIKKQSGKPILLDDLMEEAFLDVNMTKIYGIYIPKDELLKRPKYQWFAILPYEDVLNSNIILSKFFKSSIMDSTPISSEIQSLIAL